MLKYNTILRYNDCVQKMISNDLSEKLKSQNSVQARKPNFEDGSEVCKDFMKVKSKF